MCLWNNGSVSRTATVKQTMNRGTSPMLSEFLKTCLVHLISAAAGPSV